MASILLAPTEYRTLDEQEDGHTTSLSLKMGHDLILESAEETMRPQPMQ